MRSIFTLSFTLLAFSIFAQAPQGIKYQAVARDNAGTLYMNQQVAVRFSVIDSSTSGSMLYSERQVLNTNDYGLFTASLGQGVILQGTFASINWGVNSKYLKVEFDPAGGTNYFDMGTAQLLSVPYALYSEKAGTAGNSTDSQTLSISGNTLSISNGNSVTIPGGSGSSYTAGTGIDLTGNVITNTSPDQQVVLIGTGETVVSGTYPTFTVNTPAQNLSLNGNVLSITNGNSVTLPSGGGGSYVAGTGINITGTTISNIAPDQTVTLTGAGITTIGGTYPNFIVTSSQVPQVLSLNGTTLNLSNGGGSVVLPVGADNDPTNELQTLALNGTTLSLSNGNSVILPTGGLPDADSDSTNELNTGAVLNGTSLQITDAGGTLNVDLSSLVNDNDSDPTNELNTALTLNGTTLSVTDAGGSKSVDLTSLANDADSDPANEIQNLSSVAIGNSVTINISGGTGTTFNVADGDSDATNELQTLSLNGSDLTLSNGGGTVTLPAGSAGTLDQAYDFGGAGAGRTITADAGAVEITTSSSNAAAFKVTHSNTGVAVQALSTNAGNTFSTIQAETNSSTNTVAAVIGSTTGDAYAIAGQAQSSSTAFSAVFGSNLRASGGVGVEGSGFNGVAGAGNSVLGFGVFGENNLAASGSRIGSQLAAGVGSIGFVGVLGQTAINDGAGVLGINLGPTRNGTFDNPGVEGQGFVGMLGQTNTPAIGYGVLAGGDLGGTGNLAVLGDLNAGGAKLFRIDYPFDPANKFLCHFSIESNEVLNLYRGTVQLNTNGEAKIELPDYFEAINKNFSYQLTPIGTAAPALFVKNEIQNNAFTIAGGQPGQKISWQVTAERNDKHFANHPEKRLDVRNKPAHLVGKYVHPNEYGKAKEDAIIYIKNKPLDSIQKLNDKRDVGQLKLK